MIGAGIGGAGLAAQPGYRARRRHPRDEPGPGSGANTALQEAALLCRMLISAAAGTAEGGRTAAGDRKIPNGDGLIAHGDGLIAAVGDYERQMREYGYAAVAASRQAEAGTGLAATGSCSGFTAGPRAGPPDPGAGP